MYQVSMIVLEGIWLKSVKGSCSVVVDFVGSEELSARCHN